MIEAPGLEIPNSIFLGNANLTSLVRNQAYPGNGHAVNSLWYPCDLIRPHGKQQFKVFTAVQSEH